MSTKRLLWLAVEGLGGMALLAGIPVPPQPARPPSASNSARSEVERLPGGIDIAVLLGGTIVG